MIHFGEEQTIQVGDKAYRLSRWKLRHMRAFRDWIAERIGDPFAHLDRLIDKVPVELAREEIRRAEEVRDQLQAFSLASPLAQKHLLTEEGLYRVAALLLGEHHPDASEEDTWNVAMAIAYRLSDTLTKASGQIPNEDAPEGDTLRGEPTGTRSTGDCLPGQGDSAPMKSMT